MQAALTGHGELARRIDRIGCQIGPVAPSMDDVRRWGELRNLALAGHLTTLAAARRCESRGAHYRTDFPQSASVAGVRQFLTFEDLGEPASALEGRSYDASADAATALSA